ncbi:MAG: universal stress protein [Acidimicrobiales bacterium]
MYKNIVVGTDGSDRAAVAVGHALSIAKMTEATLHVVHAVPRTSLTTEFVDGAGASMSHADVRDDGALICSRVVAKAGREGVTVESHNVDGDPADVLVTVARDVNADLIVIGNKGMSGVRRFVLGSVPNKVSHHAPCSLLVVDTDRSPSL